MSPFKTFTARLVSSDSLSENTQHLEFEMVGESRFGFVAGQWLSLRQSKPDGEEITRAYSICSPPADEHRFALCLNRVQDGFMSNFLCDMKTGEEVSLQGPFGDFILHPPLRDTLFIATGTGIAPFRSMLHWLLAEKARHQEKHLWLLFGNRREEDMYYHSEFLRLAELDSNFHYLPTLSRASDGWQGLRGYVQRHVPEIAQGRFDMHAYICGLDKMVKANRELLKSLGWDRKSIRYEKYD
ncbi:MAG: FAD-dependent oxidoreductase [Candidatus Sulfotelmatobacter sp.]